MTNGPASHLPGNAYLVVDSALAARQWEIHLADAEIHGGTGIWLSPRLLGYRAWTHRLYLDLPDTPPDVLLSESQSQALWRRVVEDSPQGAELLESRSPAAWAAAARRLLAGWNLAADEIGAAQGNRDYRAFLDWHDAYRSRLRDAGWLDQAALELGLPERRLDAARPAVFCDLFEPTPGQDRLLGRLRASGVAVREQAPARRQARRLRIELDDERDEIDRAVDWAARQWRHDPRSRIALIVPGLDQHRARLSRALEAAPPPFAFAAERGLRGHAAIGAALAGLEMLSPLGGFQSFSRWLRNPGLQAGDAASRGEAALIEARLRLDLRSQLGFLRACRGAGLDRFLRQEAPTLWARLQPALETAAPAAARRTPTQWRRLWQRRLQALGFEGWGARLRAELLQAWEAALADFEQLTPIAGEVSEGRALTEFRRLLESRSVPSRLPISGIHVFEQIDQVGPGYRAAWAAGFSASRWPEAVSLNPLLPRWLQVERAMPASSPELALARSRRRLARLAERVETLIVSSPASVHEHRAAPSPLIAEFAVATPDLADIAARRRPTWSGLGGLRMERIDDRAPELKGSDIRGGSRALDLQAQCPLRAFLESRLAARPLEPFNRGLSNRLQGILAHRALETLFCEHPSQEALEHALRENGAALARQAAENALQEQFGPARDGLAPLYELELERLSGLLRALLDSETQRLPFELVGVERKQEVVVAGRRLRTRVDRIDRLSDGGLAVLDYKTGLRPGLPDWFGNRLADTQLPLYATRLDAPVRALAIVALRDRARPYKGSWALDGAFPGQPAPLPEARAWDEQLDVWRRQIAALVAEYAAGDTRIFVDARSLLTGAYAPLSRVYEALEQAPGAGTSR